MSTFVLVHGGGHGGWCYKKVKRHLETAGHEVFAPTLAGMAERSRLLSPAIDLDHHIADVVDELFYWDLRDVILAGHSYDRMWQGQDYFGVSDPADRAWLRERLTAQPWKTFDQPLRLGNQEAFGVIPQFHVICESTFKYREGSEVMRRAVAEDRLWRLDTGHDLMLTEPEALAAILLEIAGR